ncbi:GNAT family N-acetyltransferase [Winogradskyella sp. A2]|uniref:GNAT family N-acetyltransferase n=1 Tax=Winogradskyella sp. A2 TaxID=3366944 RepID=UPI00398C3ADB
MDYHNDRFTDYSLLIYKDEKLLAVLPANINNDSVYSHQGLSYGGLIHSKKIKTKDYIITIKAILNFLQDKRINDLIIKELPFIYLNNQINNPLSYICFKSNAKLVRTDLHSVIDVGNVYFSSSRKEGYKRGIKYNLKVKETESFDLFWKEILQPNLQTKHGVKPVHSLEEITALKLDFPKNIRQFNVYHNNKIVGGTTIFENENVVHCQYISGNAQKNKLGSLDYLHIELIKTIFPHKKYFSFGTSNTNNGNNINEGLQFWKEGFGAKSTTQSFYNIKTKNHQLLEDIFV